MLKISNEVLRRLANVYVVLSLGVMLALSVYAGMYLSIIVMKILTFNVQVLNTDIFHLMLALLYLLLSMLNLYFSPEMFDLLNKWRKRRRAKKDYNAD